MNFLSWSALWVASTSCTKERQKRQKTYKTRPGFRAPAPSFPCFFCVGEVRFWFPVCRFTADPPWDPWLFILFLSLPASFLPSFVPSTYARINRDYHKTAIDPLLLFLHLVFTTDLLSSLDFPYFWKPPHPANGRAKKAAPRSNNTNGNWEKIYQKEFRLLNWPSTSPTSTVSSPRLHPKTLSQKLNATLIELFLQACCCPPLPKKKKKYRKKKNRKEHFQKIWNIWELGQVFKRLTLASRSGNEDKRTNTIFFRTPAAAAKKSSRREGRPHGGSRSGKRWAGRPAEARDLKPWFPPGPRPSRPYFNYIWLAMFSQLAKLKIRVLKSSAFWDSQWP